MNASDTRTPADFPMPDFLCPSWCETDHEGDWHAHVAVGLDTRRIPAVGGGFLPDTRGPIEEWCSLGYFEPFHRAQLGGVPLSETGSASDEASVDVGQCLGEAAHIYMYAEGVISPADARRLAAVLLDAADRLEADRL